MTAAYRALDYEFVLDVPSDVRARLDRALAGLAAPVGPDPAVVGFRPVGDAWHVLGPQPTVTARDLGQAVARMLEHVNQRAAASLADEIPLHAAGVELPGTDLVVALAGSSGAGKSTLAAAAVRSGWRYVSDELTAVGDGGAVRSYHRPVGLRPGGAAALGVEYPDDTMWSSVYGWPVDSARCTDGGRLALIALVERSGVGPTTAVRPAEALATLVEHLVVPDDDRVAAAFLRLDRVVRSVPVVRLRYDAPADGVVALNQAVDRWI